MKTFTILLILLSILNIPVLMLYAEQSINTDNLSGLEKAFDLLTLGNIGTVQEVCDYRHFNLTEAQKLYPDKSYKKPIGF